MTSALVTHDEAHPERERPEEPRRLTLAELPPAETHGSWAMALTIVTEALLFVSLFFAYFYVGHRQPRWPPHPPKLALALVLLVILLASSGTMRAAEKVLEHGALGRARLLLGATIALAVVFLIVQTIEYRNHLRELQPTSNAYGSIFYAITTFHTLHVVVGLLMMIFVAALPKLKPSHSPHRPLRNAGLYWHFVDAVWVVVVLILYVLPRWQS
jgi:heme/copper-type cytochrome/quinol oxidase subunit 3